MNDVTRLLNLWNRGDPDALAELLPLVYEELRRLADHYMGRERAGHTLQPTALVHEAFIRLAGVRDGDFRNRIHFYGAAAQVMRRILVDHARQRLAQKRGENPTMVSLDEDTIAVVDPRLDLVSLDDALTQLADVAPQAARVVELRYFGGMSIDEVAELLNVSAGTVKRHWTFARAWLQRALSPT